MTDQGTVFLVGFSGCGKSTVGPRLARRLRVPFYDTDEVIERDTGRSIGEIFAVDGQRKFRTMETAIIQRLIKTHPGAKVVALGGGALLSTLNRKLVASSGRTVYLSCSIRELYRRIGTTSDRPLLQSRANRRRAGKAAFIERIRRLLEKRLAGYGTAGIRVSTTNRSVQETVDVICARLRGQHADS